uniref:uncharacterized protein LOC120835794 n=1 Tax=Gasterosteus aculeatus aculeatus TaxID=481459 RepID=UPI001A986ED6|nr:uncharacterized protein LOC120835794 [Gasterosteus aculeatus aculeatus]
MGSGSSCEYSQEIYDSCALNIYERALRETCIIPDVGLDRSLLKYSGLNSNAELQTYSDGLVNQIPEYVEKLGSSLSSCTLFPNAVGLGALMISMIIDISMKSHVATSDDSYSKFLQAFGEEKASGVRDTVSEYVKRHRMYLTDNRHLQGELERLEIQLSNHLTILRNSLLLDGQMRSRGLKIWVNGASFHVQMLIHQARLNHTTGISSKGYVHVIQAALTTYLQDLDQLLEKHRKDFAGHTAVGHEMNCGGDNSCLSGLMSVCSLQNPNIMCLFQLQPAGKDLCISTSNYQVYGSGGTLDHNTKQLSDSFINHIFSKHPPLAGLKSHFSNIKNNLNYYINQHDEFTLPSAR